MRGRATPGPSAPAKARRAIDKTKRAIDPVKALLKTRLRKLTQDVAAIEKDVALDAREQLQSGDVDKFLSFFGRIEERLKEMKREVHYRRAELRLP